MGGAGEETETQGEKRKSSPVSHLRREGGVTPEFLAIIAVGAGVLGSHLSLHRDITETRERMARLERKVEVLIASFVQPEAK